MGFAGNSTNISVYDVRSAALRMTHLLEEHRLTSLDALKSNFTVLFPFSSDERMEVFRNSNPPIYHIGYYMHNPFNFVTSIPLSLEVDTKNLLSRIHVRSTEIFPNYQFIGADLFGNKWQMRMFYESDFEEIIKVIKKLAKFGTKKQD